MTKWYAHWAWFGIIRVLDEPEKKSYSIVMGQEPIRAEKRKEVEEIKAVSRYLTNVEDLQWRKAEIYCGG